MKKHYLYLLVMLALMVGCVDKGTDEPTDPEEQTEEPVDDPEDPSGQGGNEQGGEQGGQTPTDVPPARPAPDPVVIAEPFQVHSEIIEQFITEVEYDERDYTYTHVFDEPYVNYGAPGEEDRPKALTVSWEALEAEGPLTLKLTEVESGWVANYSLKAGTGSFDLTNLVPNMSYTYEVTRDNLPEAIVGRGSFTTKGILHLLYYPTKVRNARDLGGWTTTDGKKIKFRKLYRGGLLNGGYLTNTGKKYMRAEGIKAELDLREAGDDASTSSYLGDDILFYNANIKKAYGTMIRDYPEKVKKSFEFIVRCVREEKTLYFHCSLGRDRTGTIAAVVYGVLGVSESDMSKEYELLFFSPADWSLNGGKTEFDYNRTKRWAHWYTCDTIWELGGKALGVSDDDMSVSFKQRTEAYLLSIGVTQKDIDDFRALMLE